MMFASRYRLSPRDAKALRVTDTYSLHRVVYGLFDDVREGDREKAAVSCLSIWAGTNTGGSFLSCQIGSPVSLNTGNSSEPSQSPKPFSGFPHTVLKSWSIL